MGRSSQRKGRSGELELAKLLQSFGYDVQPGEAQSYGREPDLSGLPGVHIECKRAEQIRLAEWMHQAEQDAERFHDGVPVVFHRRNRAPWLVSMHLENFMKLYNLALAGGFRQPGGGGEKDHT